MANIILPCKGSDVFLPQWAIKNIAEGFASNLGGATVLGCTPQGLTRVAGTENIWGVIPIMKDLPQDNFDILIRFIKTHQGSQNYINTGGGFFFGSDISLTNRMGYALGMGGGGLQNSFSIYRRDDSAQSRLDNSSATTSVPHEIGTAYFLRARREGNNLYIKRWDTLIEEPDDWNASAESSTHTCTHVSLLLHGYSLGIVISDIAVATGGDTATLSPEPVKVISGNLPNLQSNNYIQLVDANTNTPINTAQPDPETGNWEIPLYADTNYSINIVTGEGIKSVPKYLEGTGLLSGSFPLSMLTNEGILPSQAEIRILYRPNTGDPGDGVVVATTTCNADGTWQVSGLNENLKFDIVARIPGFNDVIISDVQPTGAPLTAHFANLKEEYEYQEEIDIQVVALGGIPPYEYQAITLPVGLSINSDTGYITGIIGDSLELIFELLVSDSEGTQFPLIGTSYIWSPAALFQNGEQGVWYDPSDLSTLFQDAAGTTPVTANGDPVGLMLDKSGNGNHASQAVSAYRPVYRTDGTLHWLGFSVNNLLETDKAVIDGLNYYWAGAHSSGPSSSWPGVVFASSDDSNGAHALYSDSRSSPMRLARLTYTSLGGQLYIDRLTKLGEGVREVISAQRSADTAAGWVNSEVQGEVSGIPGGAGSLGDLRIGVYGEVSNPMNFYDGIVLAYVPDESMRLAAERYLAIKAGVTL